MDDTKIIILISLLWLLSRSFLRIKLPICYHSEAIAWSLSVTTLVSYTPVFCTALKTPKEPVCCSLDFSALGLVVLSDSFELWQLGSGEQRATVQYLHSRCAFVSGTRNTLPKWRLGARGLLTVRLHLSPRVGRVCKGQLRGWRG